jgi:hypothetical protein
MYYKCRNIKILNTVHCLDKCSTWQYVPYTAPVAPQHVNCMQMFLRKRSK